MKRLARLSKGIVLISIIAGFPILITYAPSWTGFGSDSTRNIERDNKGKIIKVIEVEQSSKTLWDWLSVLGVPFSLVGLGFWLQQQQQRQIDEQAKLEKELSESNRREETLQAYFDRLSILLVDKKLILIAGRNDETAIAEDKEILDSSTDVIRARTLSVLRMFRTDGEYKASIIRFLIEAEVITKLRLNLSDADLKNAKLNNASLGGSCFFGAGFSGANLQNADLSYANLGDADFRGANLRSANLSGADLSGACLVSADLRDVDFRNANLHSADLRNADLRRAKFDDTNLFGAYLFDADLRDIDLDNVDLSTVNR